MTHFPNPLAVHHRKTPLYSVSGWSPPDRENNPGVATPESHRYARTLCSRGRTCVKKYHLD